MSHDGKHFGRSTLTIHAGSQIDWTTGAVAPPIYQTSTFAFAEFLRNGCDVVHLATGLVVGYPPCPNVRLCLEFLERQCDLLVVVEPHPIPLRYLEAHDKLSFSDDMGMRELAAHLLAEPRELMKSYN